MAYVRLDKIGATAHIESIVASEDLVNGQFLALGELQADGEARVSVPSGDVAQDLVFHASVPLMYEDRVNELDYVLKAGKVGRGYVLVEGDIVSVSLDGIVGGSVTKGAKVIPHAEGFAIPADPATVTGLHGKVITIDFDLNAGQLAVIRISK